MPAAFARGRLGGFQFSGWGRKSSSLTGWLGFTPAPVLTPGSTSGSPDSWHFDVAILESGECGLQKSLRWLQSRRNDPTFFNSHIEAAERFRCRSPHLQFAPLAKPMATQDDTKTKPKPSALRSIIAGSTAGAVEISITYPAEFAKTRIQLNRRLPDSKKLPWPPFGRQWYAGCTTLIIGNSLKAGIRFVAFDAYKSLLEDANGKVSGPRTVVAGFGAGITESLLAVTPFESIKTQL